MDAFVKIIKVAAALIAYESIVGVSSIRQLIYSITKKRLILFADTQFGVATTSKNLYQIRWIVWSATDCFFLHTALTLK